MVRILGKLVTIFVCIQHYYSFLVVFGQVEILPPVVTKDGSNLTALVHIGPMKTGSSAIQKAIGFLRWQMQTIDNYEDVSKVIRETTNLNSEIWNFIGCFRTDENPFRRRKLSEQHQQEQDEQYSFDMNDSRFSLINPLKMMNNNNEFVKQNQDHHRKLEFSLRCHNETIPIVNALGVEQKMNMILSAEYLTHPYTDLPKLKSFLTPWKHVRIVAYYRRYYDWFLSFHNQIYKQEYTPKRVSLVDFITKEYNDSFWYWCHYIVKAVERYREHFSDIKIVNIYDLPNHDVREAFICDAIPNAPGMCTEYHKQQQDEKDKKLAASQEQLPENNQRQRNLKAVVVQQQQQQRRRQLSEEGDKENHSVALVYSDLAYLSQEMKLWTVTESNTIDSIAERARAHHYASKKESSSTTDTTTTTTTTTTVSPYDFTDDVIICPTNEVIQWLLKQSLEVEQLLFPEYYTSKGEAELKIDFNKIVLKKKLCHIDAKKILSTNQQWIDFFKTIV